MPRKQRVLVLARREDLMRYAMKIVEEYDGFEAHGALTLEEAKRLIEESSGAPGTPFVGCAIGNMLNNAEMWQAEKAETIKLLEERNIPYKACPTFGDSATVMFELGLIESAAPPAPPQRKLSLFASSATAPMIAG